MLNLIKSTIRNAKGFRIYKSATKNSYLHVPAVSQLPLLQYASFSSCKGHGNNDVSSKESNVEEQPKKFGEDVFKDIERVITI